LDKSTTAISSVASIVAILITSLCVVSMVNIGLALWICKLMDSSYSGFFIVALFYAILSVILYVFRDQIIKTPISNSIITYVRKEKQI
jgi:membrane protein YdbS with pleckstrin-like domain